MLNGRWSSVYGREVHAGALVALITAPGIISCEHET